MKKLLTVALVLFGLTFLVTPDALAGYQISTGSTWGPYEVNPGGEFTLKPNNDLLVALNGLAGYTAAAKNVTPFNLGPQNFQSFCLEGTEYIYLNTTYNVTLNNNAMYGGNPPNGDTISKGTAWLYYNFATGGNFDGLTAAYNYHLPSDIVALQRAIWWLEGEENINSKESGNRFMDAVELKFGAPGWADSGHDQGNAGAALDNNGLYGVKAMNMTAVGGGMCQDQLVLVPEPFTLLFLGACLVGAGIAGRRFKKI